MAIPLPSDLSHKKFVYYQGKVIGSEGRGKTPHCLGLVVCDAPTGVDSPGSTIIRAQGYRGNIEVRLASHAEIELF